MNMSWMQKKLRMTTMVVANLAITVQPVLAQSIVSDSRSSGPTVLQTNNGVDMVMIETPNSAGVSINTYGQFDVAPTGVVLNNIDTNYGVTNLGGFVQGNANLAGGPASLIVNQVTTNNVADLNGYIEVGGARADVVIASPYGITCNGCGFINTDHVALTTGTLNYNGNGSLRGTRVTDGTIRIGERGLDARGVSQFDIIARQVRFAGSVQGQRVLVVAGQNDVIFATGAATAHSGSSSDSPEYAIDSTVFGGMYANQITIVSTERGSGVRAPARMATSAQGMSITADGRLVLGQVSSQGQIRAQSRNSSVVVRETVYARGPLSIQAKQDMIANADATIVSDAAVSINAGGNLTVRDSAQVSTRGPLTLTVGETLHLAQNANLVSYRNLNITAESANLREDSLIYAGAADEGETPLTAQLNFNLSGDANLESASLYATGAMTFDARDITIRGDSLDDGTEFASLGRMAINARNLTTTGARLEAAGNVDIALENDFNAGEGTLIASRRQLRIQSNEMVLAGVLLQADGLIALDAQTGDVTANDLEITSGGTSGVSVDGQSIDLDETIIIAASGDVRLTANAGGLRLDGDVQAQDDLTIAARDEMFLAGQLQGNMGFTAQANAITSSADIYGADVTLASRGSDLSVTGVITTPGNLALSSGRDLSNSAELLANGDISLTSANSLLNVGNFASFGQLAMQAGGSLTNSGTGVTQGQAAAAEILLTGLSVTNSGELVAAGDVQVTSLGGGVVNTAAIAALNDLTITSATGITSDADLVAGGTLALNAQNGDLDLSGALQSSNGLDLTVAGDFTNGSNLISNGVISLSATGDLTNSGGFLSDDAVTFSAGGALINTGSGLAATGASALSLSLTGGAVTNAGNAIIVNDINILSNVVDVENTGDLIAGGAIGVTSATTLFNDAELLSGGAMTLTAGSSLINSGTLDTANALVLSGSAVENVGALTASQTITISARDNLTTAGFIQSGGAVTLQAGRDLVSDSAILSQSSITLSSGRDATNRGNLAASGAIVMAAAGDLVNAGGALLTGQAMAGSVDMTGASIFNSADLIVAGDVHLTTTSGSTLRNEGMISARGGVTLDGQGAVVNNGEVVSNLALALLAGTNLTNTGDLTSGVEIAANAGTNLTNSGRFMAFGTVSMTANGALTNTADGLGGINASATDLNLTGGSVFNSGDVVIAGAIDITSTVNHVTNEGDLTGSGAITLSANDGLMNAGALNSANQITLETLGGSLTNSAALFSLTGLTLNGAGTVTNSGSLGANGAVTLTAQAGDLTNNGSLFAIDAITLTSSGTTTNNGDGLNAATASAQQLLLSGQSVVNSGSIIIQDTIQLLGGTGDVRQTGTIIAGDAITVASAGHAVLGGSIQSATAVAAQTGSLLSDGVIRAAQTVELTTTSGDLAQNGNLSANGNVTLASAGQIIQSNSIRSNQGDVTLSGTTGTLNGSVTAAGTLSTDLSGNLTTSGTLWANDTVTLDARGLTLAGSVTGLNAVTIQSEPLRTASLNGTIASNGEITVSAGTITMGAGAVITAVAADLTLTATSSVRMDGLLHTGQNLNVQGGSISQNGTVTVGAIASLTSTVNDVDQNGTLTAGVIEFDSARSINNTGEIFGSAVLSADRHIEVVLVFRPVCSLVKVDLGFVSGR